MNKTASKGKGASFGDLGDMMNLAGMETILAAAGDAERPQFATILRNEIKIYKQQRNADELEDEEQKLDDLAANIKARGVLQPIIICRNADGPEPWRLVAGERRWHAAGLAGLESMPAMCYESLTMVQIKDIQLAENIHRLNLSQINEAQVLKDELDSEHNGDVDALCAAISKSRSWVSKRLSLLNLPQQAQRLIREGVSADIEVINGVKTIEKLDPELAKQTVEELKKNAATPGTNARKTVNQAKSQVKPPKKKETPPGNPENVAGKADLSHQENGPVTTVPPETLGSDPALQELQKQFLDTEEDQSGKEPEANSKEPEGKALDTSKVPALPPVESLANAYSLIYESGSDPKMLLSLMPEGEREGVEDWLHSFYDAGVDAKNIAQAVINGLRNETFANEGHGAFALIAFLSGGEEGIKFNLLNILGSVKKA